MSNSPDSPDLIESFARLQAYEDARLVAQELLHAATLPPEHPLAALQQELADAPLLLAGIRLRLATLLGRLEAGQQREVSSRYATSYQQEFLRSLQKELLLYLAGAYQGLLPDESHPAARRVLERRSGSQAASLHSGRRAAMCKLWTTAQRRKSKRFLRSPR